MARRAVKAHFQPNPPEFSKVVNVTNMTKNWHWLLDGKLQNVNSEDLHNQVKELHRPAWQRIVAGQHIPGHDH